MNTKLIIVIIFFIINLCNGVGEAFEKPGNFGTGAGMATFVYPINSAYSNPSASSFINHCFISFSYSNIWWMKEYPLYLASSIIKSNIIDFTAGLGYFGSKGLYSETNFSIAVSKKISFIGAGGVRFSFLGSNFKGDKTSWLIFSDLGYIKDMGMNSYIGIWIRDVPLSTKGKDAANPKLYVGIRYEVSDFSSALLDLRLESGKPGELYFGQTIELSKHFTLMGGVGSRPTKMFFGANFYFYNIYLSITGEIHPELGLTNTVRIIYECKENTK
jgi:hypothetical protein